MTSRRESPLVAVLEACARRWRIAVGPAWPSAPLAVAAALVLLSSPASAQFNLGSQRAGTSAAAFLKMSIGARASGLGEAFVAVANDPTAIYWNPAGLASLQRREILFAHVDWPGDIRYEYLSYVMPSQRFGGSFAFQLGSLSTEMDETTEFEPLGTGRSFIFSDMVAGAAYARRWTDKLLIGAGAKYVREDDGSDVGGPVAKAVLFDMGSIYYLGYGSVRIATSLTNFGPALRPSGTFVSPISGEERRYDAFDPPIQFRYGFAFEPIENRIQRLTASLEITQPADNSQRIKSGLEWTWDQRLALRTGYSFNEDELKFAAGAGVYFALDQVRGAFDYAYTNGGMLGSVNRFSLGLRF
jgi:hypothetical protein